MNKGNGANIQDTMGLLNMGFTHWQGDYHDSKNELSIAIHQLLGCVWNWGAPKMAI